jgi:hypothetical protein
MPEMEQVWAIQVPRQDDKPQQLWHMTALQIAT